MNTLAEKELNRLATRYIWWKTPEEAMQSPRRVVAQVMNLGDFEDMRQLTDIVGEDELRETLRHAEPGEFTARSWHYWHYRLGLAELGQVPPLPQRKVA
jgi:hypothetical protein